LFYSAAAFESLTPGISTRSDLVREDSLILAAGLRSPPLPIGEEGGAHSFPMLFRLISRVLAPKSSREVFRFRD
jgi:hypothetical protein